MSKKNLTIRINYINVNRPYHYFVVAWIVTKNLETKPIYRTNVVYVKNEKENVKFNEEKEVKFNDKKSLFTFKDFDNISNIILELYGSTPYTNKDGLLVGKPQYLGRKELELSKLLDDNPSEDAFPDTYVGNIEAMVKFVKQRKQRIWDKLKNSEPIEKEIIFINEGPPSLKVGKANIKLYSSDENGKELHNTAALYSATPTDMSFPDGGGNDHNLDKSLPSDLFRGGKYKKKRTKRKYKKRRYKKRTKKKKRKYKKKRTKKKSLRK